MRRENIISGIKILLGAIVLALILGYAYTKVSPYVSGPSIHIASPKDGVGVTEKIIMIEGTVKRAAHISLNGRTVYTDEQNYLKEEVLLASGLNIFELEARDKFGRTEEKILHVILKNNL